jgi:hypothetical protein
MEAEVKTESLTIRVAEDHPDGLWIIDASCWKCFCRTIRCRRTRAHPETFFGYRTTAGRRRGEAMISGERKRITQPLFDAVDRLNAELEKLSNDGVSCDVEVSDITTIGDPVKRQIVIVRNVSQSWFFDAPMEGTP